MINKDELLTELRDIRGQLAKNYNITRERIDKLCKVADININIIKSINEVSYHIEMIFTHLYVMIDDKY